jgi:CMP-N,N'-diacetyllegionaminic acid synthase
MIKGGKVLAVIPARRGSKGLPLKNIRLLGGKPLLAWPIDAAQKSAYIDRIIVSTDCPEFAAIARLAGADAPFLRPAELAGDAASSIDVLLHAIETLEASREHFDYVVLLEPTSPLTEAIDLDAALEALVARQSEADAIVGVTGITSSHPSFAVRITSSGMIRPHIADGFKCVPRRQDVVPLYSLDGSLYISTIAALRREHSFYHQRTMPYITPRWKSFEVDDLIDFICIEAILANRELIVSEGRQLGIRS